MAGAAVDLGEFRKVLISASTNLEDAGKNTSILLNREDARNLLDDQLDDDFFDSQLSMNYIEIASILFDEADDNERKELIIRLFGPSTERYYTKLFNEVPKSPRIVIDIMVLKSTSMIYKIKQLFKILKSISIDGIDAFDSVKVIDLLGKYDYLNSVCMYAYINELKTNKYFDPEKISEATVLAKEKILDTIENEVESKMRDRPTRFEKARIIGARALQISYGAPVLIDYDANIIDPIDIAMLEYDEDWVPISIKRN